MNPITSLPPKLCAALVIAQKGARGVEKDAKNDYHQYKYASSEAVIDEGRRCLLTADLALFPRSRRFEALDLRVEQTGNDKSGKPKPPKGAIGRVEMVYCLVHTSGEAVEIASGTWVVPEAGRPEDKAEAAAVTSDLGYVLRGVLLLPRGMDTSPIEGRDDRDYRPEDDRTPEPAPVRYEVPAAAPSEARKAADRAVESQVRGPAAEVPTYDPAFVALCEDFENQARRITMTAGPVPADLYDQIIAAKLPAALAKRALFECFVAAFRHAPTLKDLDAWAECAAKITGWGEYGKRLKEESDLADARLSAQAA